MAEGWIKLHRKIMDDPMWLSESFTRAQAWVDLLSLANHKDGYLIVAGERIEIKRGQCGWSMLNLSKRWRWSRGKTKRFVNQLEIDEKIVQQTNTRNSIITICNYNKYQGDDTADETKVGQQTVQQTDIRRDTNKNDNNGKNEKNILGADKPASKKPVYESRLEDWMAKEGHTDIPREWGDYAYQTLFMTVEDINLQWDKFLDYWKSKGGSKGKKADWPATWRNWCRTSIEYKSERAK